jgi:hypothetical protein
VCGLISAHLPVRKKPGQRVLLGDAGKDDSRTEHKKKGQEGRG